MTVTVPEELQAKLQQHGQEHLVRWWDTLLKERQKKALIAQLESIDFELVANLFSQKNNDKTENIKQESRCIDPPAEIVKLPSSEQDREEWKRAKQVGEEALAAGKVGAILVAGGQGSRLDFPHSKGMFPAGPVSGNSLFQILAEGLQARMKRADAKIPYYVMTSEATHDETVGNFVENNYFGLNADDVYFFSQGSMPAVDADSGQVLLEEKCRVATSPDGHGGIVQAMHEHGILADMRDRGIEYLFYHQVDNPTAIICDPVFLGFHILRNSDLSTKVARKVTPDEKMGLVCEVAGTTQIIEYSDLPIELASQTDESGDLKLWAGNTAMHFFNREFLEELQSHDSDLPFHLANKSVAYVDEQGNTVKPEQPNAIKFERFIFDALLHAKRALVFEIDRARDFNPIKNKLGNDSPETSRAAIVALHTKWLEAAGATVKAGIDVEISPLFALDAEDVKHKIEAGTEFNEAVYLRDC